MALLEVADLHAGYNDVDVLRGVDLEVNASEVVTIAGTNGAGKSTLAKALMGLMPRCTGTRRFAERDLALTPAECRIDEGISYVPQVANVFGHLTVHENLAVVRCREHRKARIDEVYALFPALHARRRLRAALLSGGERQQLAFARALLPGPRLLLLDEPTAALSPALATQVFDRIASLPSLGVAVLLVEQRARASLERSDRGYVLDGGKVVMSGSASALLGDPSMADLYLGQH
ncbi:MAG TPA: ATP-binding cassette domain-containing protein [Casimicrobiaceae bacterium]|nr:ATP-binding cassette domain-containing protein [Casimicrobiaceae bacterium]